jgi:hypothetical protein
MMVQPPRLRRGRAWNEAAIREELTAFVAGRTTWPTYREFIAGGGKGLREAVARIGGATYWAQEMGLADSQRPRGGIVRWTDETIEAALAAVLAGRETWPTRIEFAEAGLRGLSEILRERGDAPLWAKRMGVKPPRQIHRTKKQRTPAKPRKQSSPPKPWPRWSDQTITAALTDFLSGRDEWPRHSEFVDAGHKGLYHAILKHGGSRVWAQRMGVRWVERKGGQHRPKQTEARARTTRQRS